MKVSLADLMEAGIENTEPQRGIAGRHNLTETKKACATGAAEFPIEAGMIDVDHDQLEELLGVMVKAEGYGKQTLEGILWKMNDLSQMSREAICEWVRSIQDEHDLYLTVGEKTPEPKLPISQAATHT